MIGDELGSSTVYFQMVWCVHTRKLLGCSILRILYLGLTIFFVWHYYVFCSGLSYRLEVSTFESVSFWRNTLYISGEEWFYYNELLVNVLPFLCVNAVGSFVVRLYQIDMLPMFYICVSSLCTIELFGFLSFLAILFIPVSLYIVAMWKTEAFVYVVSSLLFLAIIRESFSFSVSVQYGAAAYHFMILLMWTWARSLDLSLHTVYVAKFHFYQEFIYKMSYALYLPFLFMGPLISYVEFEKGVRKENVLSKRTSLRFLWAFGLCCSWWVLTQLFVAFLPTNPIRYKPQLIDTMNSYELFGFILCSATFFYLKYLVFYGFPGSIAEIEGINTPHTPRCIYTIYTLRDLWKTFDVGLHQFMHKNIYKPMRESFNYITAVLATYTFIYFWHGLYDTVLYWTVINCIITTAEYVFHRLSRRERWHAFQSRFDDQLKTKVYSLFNVPVVLGCYIVFMLFLDVPKTVPAILQRMAVDVNFTALLVAFAFLCSQTNIK